MATLMNNENKSHSAQSPATDDGDIRRQALDQLFAEMSLREAPQPATKQPTSAAQATNFCPPRETPVPYQPAPRQPVAPVHGEKPDWTGRFLKVLCIGCMLLGASMFYRGMPSSWRAAINPFADSQASPVNANASSHSSGEKHLATKPIQDVRVGERIAGRNPIREQVEGLEPDSATWQKISLYMTKESGLGLWIDLLRPLTWIEAAGAKPGQSIHLTLYEMGAVGEAEVIYLGPCPEIQPGKGTVVTGTFKHQADENSNVVHLKLEDQIELTGVTANHLYWSEDRQDFVEVGNLRTGELINTAYGLKHVISVTPIELDGFLYNLETTEHVYRVGSLGTLVHNACADELRKALNRAGVYGDPGTVPHHLVSRFDSKSSECEVNSFEARNRPG